MGTRRVAGVADAVCETVVRAYKAALADVELRVDLITRVGIRSKLRAMLVRHNDNVLGQLCYISLDELIWMIFFRKSKPLAQQV